MLFTTLEFFIYLFAIWLLYWKTPNDSVSKYFLLLASWFFYSYWDVSFFPLIILSTSIDYLCALKISENQSNGRDGLFYVFLSVTINLCLLGFFKYGNAIVSLFPIMKQFYVFNEDNILLPLGISFYTFQTISYTVDVYKGKVRVCEDFVDMATYVAFFPQLIAGPIERASSLLEQIKLSRVQKRVDWATIEKASALLFLGVFKKVAIANNLAPYTEWGIAEKGLKVGGDIWLCAFAFITQFLCDYSAYTDMAIGIGLLFGIKLHENFKSPYFATSPSDFWRKWHITLGLWFRDYVYEPLRNNLKAPRVLALIITMSLVGVWHGGKLKFLVWGSCWGILIFLDYLLKQLLKKKSFNPFVEKTFSLTGWLLTILSWTFLGFFFVCHNLEDAFYMQKKLFSLTTSKRFNSDLVMVLYFIVPFYIIEGLTWWKKKKFFWKNWSFALRLLGVSSFFIYLLTNKNTNVSEFIYFQF